MSLNPYLYNEAEDPTLRPTKFDDAAFEVFFKEYFVPLCTYCEYKFGFDLDLAKEAVHSGFIRLWENRHTISSHQSLKAYLYKIVTNISLDLLRHRKVVRQHETFVTRNVPVNFITSDYSSADFKQLKNDIDKAVRELPEQMRCVFELSRYEGLKYLEIANQLGVSVKTVENDVRQTGIAVSGVAQDGSPYTGNVSAQTYYSTIWATLTDQFVTDADFIKLRQVVFGYTFPKTFFPKTIQSANISFVGRNLFLLYNTARNIDPESSYANGNAQGLENFGLPTARSYGVNLQLRF